MDFSPIHNSSSGTSGSGAGSPLRRWATRWWCRTYATYLIILGLIFCLLAMGTFITVSALASLFTAKVWLLTSLGLGVALVLPLFARVWINGILKRRFNLKVTLGGAWFFIICNTLAVALFCLGFSHTTGQALRLRGDWFLGQADGWLVRRYRASLLDVSRWMERFDLPSEARPLLAEAMLPQSPENILPPIPEIEPLEAPLLEPRRKSPWFHPLGGQRRAAPPNSACRFGASRPGRRPPECGLGHCGVDLFQPLGSPVYAAFDGVVLKAVRSEAAGGIAGRFIKLSHKDGEVITSYVHLHGVRADLRPGMTVKGGELIGTLGLTGIKRSLPHLHFSLAVKQGGRKRFIDPELLLTGWRLPSSARPLVAVGP